MQSGGFRLPITPLLPDDTRLTIQAIGLEAEMKPGASPLGEREYASNIFQVGKEGKGIMTKHN